MSDLKKDIEFYVAKKEELELAHTGKWVLIYDQKIVNIQDSFEKAAAEAVKLFGDGPYLLRQIGAPPFVLPASIMYRRVSHA